MFRRCCQRGPVGSPPEWIVGIIAAVLLCFFIWFLALVLRDLFSGEKVTGFKLKRPCSGRMCL